MVDVLTRDPAGKTDPVAGQRVAQARLP